MLHVVGDSHVMLFTGQKLPFLIQPPVDFKPQPYDLISGYSTYFCPLLRAYRMIDNEYVWKLLATFPPGASVLLVLGEIDCRGPIINEAHRAGKSIQELTQVCAERYLSGVRRVKEMGLNPIIFSPYPQKIIEHIKDSWVELPEYLTPTDWVYLKKRTVYFFESAIKLGGFPVVSINGWFADESIDCLDEYWADHIHLSEKAWPIIEAEIAKVLS